CRKGQGDPVLALFERLVFPVLGDSDGELVQLPKVRVQNGQAEFPRFEPDLLLANRRDLDLQGQLTKLIRQQYRIFIQARSEERRVGKECRCRRATWAYKE